jgi:RNA polymerase sigma factor (TIGR02999 family)
MTTILAGRGKRPIMSVTPPSGNSSKVDQLVETAYGELRRIAQGYLSRERADHTLQPTALVNEAYLRLADQKTEWQNRTHFLGIAALLMRRVLREHARAAHADRRGADAQKVVLEDNHSITGGPAVDFIVIERALSSLAELDPDAAKVVELRFFGGLSIEDAATELGVSLAVVKRHWTVAKAYLKQQLRGGAY